MAAHQATPSLGFSTQEHWSGLPFPSPMHDSEKWKWSHLVVSDSSRPHGLQPTMLLCPWDSPGKNTGVGCHFLLQGIFRRRDQTQISLIAGRCFNLWATREPQIKLPTSAESSKKQESSRKTSISALLTMPKPLTVWITINCGKFWKRWEYQTT